MSDPVPAITEDAATGETAALFADIRAVYGVSVVNLIWRHLATMPGALAWTWQTVRPIYVDGSVARAAAELRAAMLLPPCPVLPDCVTQSAGLSPADMAGIRAVLAAYDRTNAMALIALSAAQAHLAGRSPAGAGDGTVATEQPGRPLSLPPLLALDAMAPATADLVLALNRIGTRRDDPILASMYRNLAHWPAYLALAWTVLAPMDAGPALLGTISTTRTAATDMASRLAFANAPPPDLLPPATRSQIATALERFTDDAIGRMVVLCAILRRASG